MTVSNSRDLRRLAHTPHSPGGQAKQGRRNKPDPTNIERSSPLLSLPPEIRDHLLSEVLSGEHANLALLTTCKQLSMDVQPLLYDRPIVIGSQDKLFHWIDRSQASNLRRLRTLTIQLLDVDLSILLAPGTNSQKPALTAWTLYQEEITRLEAAFRKMPRLKHLTVLPPETVHSKLFKSMYLSFLALVPLQLPGLTNLTVHDDPSIGDAIPGLKDLANVVFTEPATQSQDDDKPAKPGKLHSGVMQSPSTEAKH